MVYRFNTICNKISAVFFAEIDKLIRKFIWKFKGPRITKTILKKKKLERSYFTISKLTTEATVIKTVQFWQQNRRIDQ